MAASERVPAPAPPARGGGRGQQGPAASSPDARFAQLDAPGAKVEGRLAALETAS
ncbi:hypothetical protein ACIRP2_11160 [Streptomyces sp. NPDC101194]|uniref:hypothetical protein n=1 Tax=Streptomyces sp. NPDC101194 TaxID=3366127 RepID=UPI00382CF471